MSTFTEELVLKRLSELNSSKRSIETLSLWLIHHRKHHLSIIKTWLKELQTVPEVKKLSFMYLANDVIQNSKKKGPEYRKEYANILPKAFAHIGNTCKSEKLFGSLDRLLNIWEERGVYDAKVITYYRSRLNREHSTAATAASSATKKSGQEKRASKRKLEEHKTESKRIRISPNEEINSSAVVVSELNGNGDQSPYLPLGKPAKPEELIRALKSINNSASSDAVVRERIANLLPEIPEVSSLTKLWNKDAANSLAKQVNAAVEFLNDSNSRLCTEMEERTKLTSMLMDFEAKQKLLLAQADKRLEENKKILQKVMAVQKEIRGHLSNLHNLPQIPDITSLPPLPSAAQLFKKR